MKKLLSVAAAVAVALAVALPSQAATAQQHAFTGKVVQVDATAMSLTLKSTKGTEKTFTLTDKAKISTKGKKTAALGDLKVGDMVTAHYTMHEGNATVSKIAPASSHTTTSHATTTKPAG